MKVSSTIPVPPAEYLSEEETDCMFTISKKNGVNLILKKKGNDVILAGIQVVDLEDSEQDIHSCPGCSDTVDCPIQ